MSVTIRNNHPIDPNSPTIEIVRGTGKNQSTDRVLPQQSVPLGEGDLTINVVYPKNEAEGEAKVVEAKADAEVNA